MLLADNAPKYRNTPIVILAKARIQIGGFCQPPSMRMFLDSSLCWNGGGEWRSLLYWLLSAPT